MPEKHTIEFKKSNLKKDGKERKRYHVSTAMLDFSHTHPAHTDAMDMSVSMGFPVTSHGLRVSLFWR